MGLGAGSGRNIRIKRVMVKSSGRAKLTGDGMSIDHSYDAGCRSKACCNPDHLVAMSVSENSKLRWEICKQ